MTTVPLDGLGRELDRFTQRLYDSLSAANLRRVGNAAGMAAKKAGDMALVQRLGSDRAMRNMRPGRPVKLGLGYDITGDGRQVQMNHRPAGLWVLADRGRQRIGPIFPRVNGRKRNAPTAGEAVMTPRGPRAYSSNKRKSRGTGVFQLAAARERDAAPKAAAEELFAIIGAQVATGASTIARFAA